MQKVHGFFRPTKKPMQKSMDLNTHTKKKSKTSREKKTCKNVWIDHHTAK
jgi:hypothetical protein